MNFSSDQPDIYTELEQSAASQSAEKKTTFKASGRVKVEQVRLYAENMVIKSDCPHPVWYILRSFMGQEQRAINQLQKQLEIYGLEDKIVEIFTPKEQIVVLDNNTTKHKQESFYPGYVFVAFDVANDREIHDVAKLFMKERTELCKVTHMEINKMKQLVEKSSAAPTTAMNLNVGNHVRVIDGPYLNMTGRVEKLDMEQHKVIVKLEIFGKEIAVDLDITQVKAEAQ